MELDPRQLRQDLRGVLQRQPVELEVMAGGEMAPTPAIDAGHPGQGAELVAREQAVGNRDAQHGAVALDVESVLESQRAQRVGRELARQVALQLVAELGDPLLHQALVVRVVSVHGHPVVCRIWGRAVRRGPSGERRSGRSRRKVSVDASEWP